ncbi:hypothetical protein DERP_008834 [Dermatophagoides pteronyssinus]|uniref:Uncharacterized protein n=1 Tax=Dermatophagoides pteronyssinus TaxID=6956 RepID=A0ABQ8IWF5_DERPT|nr:hypothetical protein DERP_008834 [Dermatophagoides pteronyssinus]
MKQLDYYYVGIICLMKIIIDKNNAPNGNVPVGVNPFNCKTLSDSSRNTENTRAILPIARILLLTFSPTNGNDHVKTSIKLGNQYGCGEQLNWRMFITLFSYLSMAALLL